MLWAGGRLQKDKGNILRYAASAKFGLVGDVVGDIELDGNLTTRFKLFGDSVKISANAEFNNQAQPYLLQTIYPIISHGTMISAKQEDIKREENFLSLGQKQR